MVGWILLELWRAETVGRQVKQTREPELNTRQGVNRVLRRMKEVAGQLLRHGERGESGIRKNLSRADDCVPSCAVVGLAGLCLPNSGLFLCPISSKPWCLRTVGRGTSGVDY